jgi:hypothetical protein
MLAKHKVLFGLLGGIISVFLGGVAQAGIPKAFVSAAGSDFNPCFDTKPCRTFNKALMVVDPGGEIVAESSGGYSPQFTITQSVTIDAGGNDASVNSTFATDLCTIDAGVNDRIVLRGITFHGNSVGGAAISVKQAGSVYVEHCSITEFTGDGIQMQNGGNLFVNDTDVRKCSTGVVAETFGARPIKLVASDSRFSECHVGVDVETENAGSPGIVPGGPATGLLSTCTVSLCDYGFNVVSAGGAVDVTLTNCQAFENTLGVAAESATVRLDHCVITKNGTGILAASASVLGTTAGTNLIDGNSAGNAVTGSATLQ